MIEACDLVNIYTLQHGEAPSTHKQGLQQIDVMFISHSLVEHVKGCGILKFDSMFLSDHIPIYVDFDISTLFCTKRPATRQHPPDRRIQICSLQEILQS
jgi:hypothetical protein